jgi:glycosyltransferase involved in cell wall biosynthesis
MRGLEDAIRAIPLMRAPIQLHIRARVLDGYEQQLRDLARQVGAGDCLVFHPLIAPDSVVRAAADHDVGLVLSQPCCDNHRRWIPNKLYAYLMAGVAVVATNTAGHRAALAAAPGASACYEPGSAAALATVVNSWIADPARLHAARAAAFAAAQDRLNWDVEQHRLVQLIDSVAPAAAEAPDAQAAYV